MTDLGDDFRAMREHRQAEGRRNRALADEDWLEVRDWLADRGFDLRRNTEAHYQVTARDPGWTLDVYPGNRRLYRATTGRPRAPFLRLPDYWVLWDLARALVAWDEKRRRS